MLQLGFDLDYTDADTGKMVPWAEPTDALLDNIAAAPWKVVDIETTGLNPASKPINVSGKDMRRGVRPDLRTRVCTVLWPEPSGVRVEAFDLDKHSLKTGARIARAAMSEMVIGHNVGFDAYWLRTLARDAMPQWLLDTMLLARVLKPESTYLLAKMASDETIDPALQGEAYNAFLQGRSGWSLADLVAVHLGEVMEKGEQKPRNWAEPFLTQRHYNYATGDVRQTYRLLCRLLGSHETANPDLRAAYLAIREGHSVLELIEPQVAEIVEVREHGMPWRQDLAEGYVQKQREKVAKLADKLVEMEPKLAPLKDTLANFDAGVNEVLKKAIAEAFSDRGLVVNRTATGLPQIGEKDLRRVQAAQLDQTREFFTTWVGIQKAKKAGSMARDFSGFANRSATGRIHSNLGHGPVTNRLSSSEPNGQQAPGDQAFREAVYADEGKAIISVDYSALDMRVGAALAIRAQMQIAEVARGERTVDPVVDNVIRIVFEERIAYEKWVAREERAIADFEAWRARMDTVGESDRKGYWEKWRKLKRELLLSRFARALCYCRLRAREAGTETWGSLRDAFSIPGMDIHTWTTLSMTGEDPVKLFKGLSDEELAAALKKYKGELGDRRKTGKVSNLSLTYAMQAAGFVDSAARIHDIHWTLEEGAEIRRQWFGAYVEIDLWHAWTELNQFDTVMVPDSERGGRISRKPVFQSYTLANRLIYAFGLNAALSYEDQSTGADILGRVLHTFKTQYPQYFDAVINQIHDELLFEVPEDKAEEWGADIQRIMNECAEYFLGPYGVRAECSPAIGKFWIKD